MSKAIYTIDDEPIVLSKHLMDVFLHQDDPSNLLSMYCFYYYTAKWQQTNQPHATNEYVAKGLKWGIDKVKKYRSQLLDLNLIESITQKDKNNKITGHFIKVNFVWRKINSDKLSTGVISPLVAESSTNALSTNNGNALSTNKEKNTGVCIVKTLFNDEKIKENQFPEFYKRYPRKVKKGDALTAWNKLCKQKDRPTWKEIRIAIAEQSDSELWTKMPDRITYPATWLNGSKWLNSASDLIIFEQKETRNLVDNDYSYEDTPLPDHILKQQRANQRRAEND